jgi:16S rRNA (guanine527-N7)-methyltransferase
MSSSLPATRDDGPLRRWVEALLRTPGLTGFASFADAWRNLVEDALRAADAIAAIPGGIVDVGSGGGSPGIPLAWAFPDRQVTLLEARGRKCEFLRAVTATLPNVTVVHGRAEEQEPDVFGAATAKALAAPPVAAEWCLPLVRPGGAAVLWVGPSADVAHVARVAARIGGADPELRDGLLVLPKVAPTPPGFPRRPGIARKRPLP